MSARLSILSALVVVASSVAPAKAQTLLDDLLPQQGVCTCAVIEPPNNCSAALSEPRANAEEYRRQVRADCATRWRAGCEEQNGWQACNSPEASQALARQCDAVVAQVWAQQIAPQLDELSRQCNQANAAWIQQCETVDRPQNCQTCDDMSAEIATLEADIAEAQDWIDGVRNGAVLRTSETEAEMAQRIDELDQWESELEDKRQAYATLQDTEFCPRT